MARRVGGLLDHSLEDGLEEAGVFGECSVIAGGEGRLDRLFGGGSDQFKAADEDAAGLSWRGRDGERKNEVHEVSRNDIEETRTFFKPGGLPGFEHGVSLVSVQSVRNEDAFQIAEE